MTAVDTFQPYAFLLHGRRSPRTPPSGSSSAGSRTPTQAPADLPAGAASEHSKHLGEHLDFIVPPHITPIDHPEAPSTPYCLFLGHLRFETTTADVRWLVKKLTGVTPVKAEVRGNGCCVVYLASEQDEVAVRTLNRRVLFDHHGVWFARTADSVDVLMDYVEKVLPRLGGRRKCLRLPRDSLVVEESRSAKRTPRRTPPQLSRDPRHYAMPSLGNSPPTPYALESTVLGGFHIAPPDYALPFDSHASSFNASSSAPPPYRF